MNQTPILWAPSDFASVNPFTEINFQVKFPKREQWTEPSSLPATGEIVFYTDGSLMNGSAGAGIFCASPELKLSIPLGQYTSVFQAETYAISVCTEH
jgi:hypothetical protein